MIQTVFSVIKYYGGSYRKALCHLYPNIGLDEQEFTFKPRMYLPPSLSPLLSSSSSLPSPLIMLSAKYWMNLDNRRALLEKFARIHSFDPLVAKGWYKVSTTQVEEIKVHLSFILFSPSPSPSSSSFSNYCFPGRPEYAGVLQREPPQSTRSPLPHHPLRQLPIHSTPTYLTPLPLSPSLSPSLSSSLFVSPHLLSGYHWREAHNTRIFLDHFADEHQFDPLIAENWYKVSTLALKKAKV